MRVKALVGLFISTLAGGAYCFSRLGLYLNPYWLYGKYRKLRPYIIAQARWETDDFSSRLWTQQNNAFGMKQPRLRATTSIGERNGYASYACVNGSLQDLFLWFEYNWMSPELPSVYDYVLYLAVHGYFEDSIENYTTGLNSKMK